MRKLCLFIVFVFISGSLAQSTIESRKIYRAIHTNPHAPVIDGTAEDFIWDKASPGKDFVQVDPVEGDSVSQTTFFKICYDEKNLYILFHALDNEPNRIASRLSRKDQIEDSDFVGIILDSYSDRRTGFGFFVNAAGVKRDEIFSDDSEEGDISWDPVWEAKTSLNASGWIAEMRIPFSQLRFARKAQYAWGMNAIRFIQRKQEFDEWQLVPKDAAGFISYFGYLEGIQGIKAPKRIELLPYTVSKMHASQVEADNPFRSRRDFSAAGGLDGKFGLTSDLTVDFTFNPDFGQVEADPSEVNLSAFETFFEEKRPFFVEGKNIFNFALGLGDGGFSRESLFYSRRIGRTPHYSPDLGDDEYASIPEQTSILGAGKLSGKTSGGWSIGVLDAVTQQEKARIQSGNSRRTETVEPLTNYLVGRLQRDFREGKSTFGAMLTATNREIHDSQLNFINKSAYTGGIDWMHQWHDKTYFFDLKLAGSHIRGHRDALLEVQTASARYFQRPDADYVQLDSSRTALTGHGGSITIGKSGNGKWRFAFGGVWRSPGFELNDVGFLQEADQATQILWIGYQELNPVGIFRRLVVNVNQWNGWNFGGEKMYTGGNINGGGQFLNYWGVFMGINRHLGGLSSAALRGGPSLRTQGDWTNFYNVYSDSRKAVQLQLQGYNQWNKDGISHSHQFSLGLVFKPSYQLNLAIDPFFNKNLDDLQYVSTEDFSREDRYILGRIDQKTLGFVFRVNYSLTPELSIQYYGQPFISAGRYSKFKYITRPRAQSYADRFSLFNDRQIFSNQDNETYTVDENRDGRTDYSFDNPNFNFKQFRSNLVIRWEYRPGSQFYLVWSQGRTGFDSSGNFEFGSDLRNLFTVSPDNIFLVKFNHWFSI